MEVKNDSNLFYVCSLLEYIGRTIKRKRREVTEYLGIEAIGRIYEYADVFHCEPIEKVASEFIGEFQIKKGNFDNETDCRYLVPDYWTVGEVYERLIEDCYPDRPIDGIWEVYHSWISDSISDYNTDFYYQPRDYIAECYKQGAVL